METLSQLMSGLSLNNNSKRTKQIKNARRNLASKKRLEYVIGVRYVAKRPKISRRNQVKSARRNLANKKRLASVKRANVSKLAKNRANRRQKIRNYPEQERQRRIKRDIEYEALRNRYPTAGLLPRGLAGVRRIPVPKSKPIPLLYRRLI